MQSKYEYFSSDNADALRQIKKRNKTQANKKTKSKQNKALKKPFLQLCEWI